MPYDKLRGYIGRITGGKKKLEHLPTPDAKKRVYDEASAAEYGEQWNRMNRKAMSEDLTNQVSRQARSERSRDALAGEQAKASKVQGQAAAVGADIEQREKNRSDEEERMRNRRRGQM